MDENLMEKNLLELYKECNKNRIDYNVRKWETVKFTQSIFSALMSVFVTIVIAVIELEVNNPYVLLALLLIPIYACVALCIGMQNLERESRLLFMEEGTMFKILKLISIPNKVPDKKRKKRYDKILTEKRGIPNKISIDKRWIKKDKFLLPSKYRKPTYGICNKKKDAFDEWVNLRTKNHKFLHIINCLFISEMGLSIVIIIVILYKLYMKPSDLHYITVVVLMAIFFIFLIYWCRKPLSVLLPKKKKILDYCNKILKN